MELCSEKGKSAHNALRVHLFYDEPKRTWWVVTRRNGQLVDSWRFGNRMQAERLAEDLAYGAQKSEDELTSILKGMKHIAHTVFSALGMIAFVAFLAALAIAA